ncbi:MAG TPA: CHAT domain-containing protein [Blastocatellia bacterium]|nr:CHAT domain-containing protein [Blastocatellia bacterium]
MLIRRFFLRLVILSLSAVPAQAQVTEEPQRLESGKPVERAIAGGESHTYQIRLESGQFMRVLVDQKGIDLTLAFATPQGEAGKATAEVNLNRVDLESLSYEATIGGEYRLTVRALGAETLKGTYKASLEFRQAATAQDRQRISAERLLGEGYASYQRGQAQTATEKLEQALPLWREVGDQYWEAYALTYIGYAGIILSRSEQAIEYFEQARTIYRRLKDPGGDGNALNGLGTAWRLLGRAEKAIEYYEQSVQIRRETSNRYGEGSTLSNLGLAYGDLSRHEKAIEQYERALQIAREVKDRALEGRALNGLGLASSNLGHYEKSIEYYEQALTTSREVKNRSNEAILLNNLGITYEYLGRTEKAIEYYEQALGIQREVKSRQGEAAAFSNLAGAYYALGNYEKAIESYEQSLAICREVKDRKGEGIVLSLLGASFNALGQYQKAIEYLDQALAIDREGKARSHEGSALANLARAYSGLSDPEKAIEYYEQSLAISREVKNLEGEGNILNHLAELERDRGNLDRARILIEDRLRIAESMRSGLVSPESRASLLASVQNAYEFYTDLLMRQHKAEPNKGLDALAVEVSERKRARSLLDLLTEARANVRQGVDATVLERERLLGRQINDKAQRLTQASKPEQGAALRQEISQLENDYERAQAEIRKASPHYAALTQPQPLKLKEIQQQLDPDTLLLEYALGEERSYLWVVTKDSLSSYQLPKAEQIKQSALQVYELLTARSTSKRGESPLRRQERITQADAKLPVAAQELSQTLLAPVAATLGNKRLVIVADGALQYVPFAMLPEPSPFAASPRLPFAVTPLIVNHEVVSLPSASALAIQRSELAGRQLAPKMLAVIADPVFDRTDARFTTSAIANTETAPSATLAFDDARSIEHLADNSADKSGVANLKLVIPRLPFTRQEATRLLALTPKNSSFGAIDFQANRETVLNPELSQYRYVHFATHGLLDTERPGLSSLVLSMVDAKGNPRNGFLRANDIYNLKLPAELVVLSACQTGLGKEIKGEGLVGLTRGFMYAGAARVVVSLWSVNDKATADLMTKFYEKMLKQGGRPAAALRAAQVEMWKQGQWQSPYYWAAFTMQGEWR